MEALKGLRILFADDDKYFMRPTIDALEHRGGASVKLVTDGTSIIKYLRDHLTDLPDVLILDIMMSGGEEIKTEDDGRSTGIEVYNYIRNKLELQIPIVVETVVSDPNAIKHFDRDANVRIIHKPYYYENIRDAIKSVLTTKGN